MTTRVQLIVTGDLELKALHLSLGRAFAGTDIEFAVPQKTQGFTSNTLPAYSTTACPGTERTSATWARPAFAAASERPPPTS